MDARPGRAEHGEGVIEDPAVRLLDADPAGVDDRGERVGDADLGEQLGEAALGVGQDRDPHAAPGQLARQRDHPRDLRAPQVGPRLLVPQPVDQRRDLVGGDPGPREQRGHQRAPGVPARRIDERVVALPGGGGGGGERRGGDGDAALGQPAREERDVQVDHGLAGVEGDDGGLDRRVPVAGCIEVILARWSMGSPPPRRSPERW